jgi:hypothetical protein
MLTFGMMSADEVSKVLPTLLSLVAELTALFGPFVLAVALLRSRP